MYWGCFADSKSTNTREFGSVLLRNIRLALFKHSSLVDPLVTYIGLTIDHLSNTLHNSQTMHIKLIYWMFTNKKAQHIWYHKQQVAITIIDKLSSNDFKKLLLNIFTTINNFLSASTNYRQAITEWLFKKNLLTHTLISPWTRSKLWRYWMTHKPFIANSFMLIMFHSLFSRAPPVHLRKALNKNLTDNVNVKMPF